MIFMVDAFDNNTKEPICGYFCSERVFPFNGFIQYMKEVKHIRIDSIRQIKGGLIDTTENKKNRNLQRDFINGIFDIRYYPRCEKYDELRLSLMKSQNMGGKQYRNRS